MDNKIKYMASGVYPVYCDTLEEAHKQARSLSKQQPERPHWSNVVKIDLENTVEKVITTYDYGRNIGPQHNGEYRLGFWSKY